MGELASSYYLEPLSHKYTISLSPSFFSFRSYLFFFIRVSTSQHTDLVHISLVYTYFMAFWCFYIFYIHSLIAHFLCFLQLLLDTSSSRVLESEMFYVDSHVVCDVSFISF